MRKLCHVKYGCNVRYRLNLKAMKKLYFTKIFLAAMVAMTALLTPVKASAQYYQIVNQAANMLQNAAIGGFRYKGLVDVSYTGGFGNLRANFVGVSTSQGFQYADWFFMGAGLGVDVVFSETQDGYQNSWGDNNTHTCGVMIPLFTDFRFNIGDKTNTSFFIGVKAGGSFLVGGDYLAVRNGYISNSEYFYLKPSIGVRIPTNESGKQAVNIGVTYQLLTCNYWYNNYRSGTLNSLGATVSYEW